MAKAIKLLIADDHQLVIDGIKSLLSDVDDIIVVSEANTGKQAIEIIANEQVDVVLMDIDMPVMNGYDATLHISKVYPKTKIIVLSMHDEKAIINKMIEAGAMGYILKNINKANLIDAIRGVARGGQYFGSDISLSLLKNSDHSSNTSNESQNTFAENVFLTKRENEIIKFITQGFSNTEIGKMLYISHRTVDTHRMNIMKKLNVTNLAGLIKYAIQNNLFD